MRTFTIDPKPLVPTLLLLAGCGGAADLGSPPGVAVLGYGSHATLDRAQPIGGRSDGLRNPRDLAFNPEAVDELWVVNEKDDSATVFFDVGTPDQVAQTFHDPFALHFMDHVSAIDFGAPGTFATAQDSTNTYNDSAPENFFMGPTLWSSDFGIFAQSNPEAVDALGFDLGSHLDMLHESPESIGIAWEKANVYWVFDGYNQAIARYDFRSDHGVGFDDHSDGVIHKWLMGKVKRKAKTPSHLVFDHDTDLLYVADTGNNRILVIDTTSGRPGDPLPAFEPGTEHLQWKGADWWVLVEGEANLMKAPSGIELVDGLLLVTDVETSVIYAFDPVDGRLLDWAPTGLPSGSLAGIVARDSGDLWYLDAKGNALYRLQL